MFGVRAEDDFINEARPSRRGRPTATTDLLVVILVGLAGFLVWAATHTIEEVAKGSGRVVPSRQLQVVQSPDGGVVTEIAVREGDVVQEGRVLMRIDDTRAGASLGELRERETALQIARARVEAEAQGAQAIAFSDELELRAPEAVRSEQALFRSRQSQLQAELAVLETQLAQRQAAVLEAQANTDRLVSQIAPMREEVRLMEDLARRNAMPRVDLLRLYQQLAALEGELDVTEARLPGLEAAVREAQTQLRLGRSSFVTTALERNAQIGSELAVLRESIRAASDTVTRTALRAPVTGTVNRIAVATIGAVVQPGAPLIEIVPQDDNLLISAQFSPRDVAFIRPGLGATVQITAYDFLVYGSLDGVVERLGADTVEDADGNPVFEAMVRTSQTALATGDGGQLPITPGMIAQVNIQTGEKTVLDYLLSPFRRVQAEALRER